MRSLWLVALSACSIACGSSSQATAPIPGFVMTRETTKCLLGDDVKYSQIGRWDTWQGTEGAFKINVQNGAALCIASVVNVDGPDLVTETSEVKQYFVGVGLSEDQIGAQSETYTTNHVCTSATQCTDAQLVDVRFAREIEGVLVSESVGEASLAGGHSYTEAVYWPTLPGSVLDELHQLQAIVSDPTKLAAYRAKLPSDVIAGTIVIHHTSQFIVDAQDDRAPIPLVAHACYDALVADGETGSTQCYLPDGTAAYFPLVGTTASDASASPQGS